MLPRSSQVSTYYRPELDVLRLLAFSLVFLNHAFPDSPDPRVASLAKGLAPYFYDTVRVCSFGLSLFFVLSAFLICELLLRERQITRTISIGQFYLRRILRIWPLYYFGLAIGVVLSIVWPGNTRSLHTLGLFAVFLGSWECATYGWPDNPMTPLWSVSVEEQFYLTIPLILKHASRKVLYLICGLLIVLSSALLYRFGAVRASGVAVWANSLVQFQCFAAGMLLCLGLRSRLPRLSFLSRMALVVAALAAWFISSAVHTQFDTPDQNPGSWSLVAGYALATIGCVLFLIAFLGLPENLLPKWAIHFGRISYGLYVFHPLAIGLVLRVVPSAPSHHYLQYGLKVLLAYAITVLFAALSFRFLESPFLHIKRRHTLVGGHPV